MSRWEELLEARGVLVADGAMGTNLFAAGLDVSRAPETWLEERPDAIGALHRAFLAADLARGVGLDHQPDFVQVAQFGGRQPAHHGAPARVLFEVALRGQPAQRLAHRRARHAGYLAGLRLLDESARLETSLENGGSNPGVGTLAGGLDRPHTDRMSIFSTVHSSSPQLSVTNPAIARDKAGQNHLSSLVYTT